MRNPNQLTLLPMGKKTKSTKEAMRLLHLTRQEQIQRARLIAEGQIFCNGSTHIRLVRAEMSAKGLLGKGKEFWLGCIFRSPEFEWTGNWFTYRDGARNIHERTVKVWRLTSPAEARWGS